MSAPQQNGEAAQEAGAPWTATVLTLFPEVFPGPLGVSLAGKALQRDLWRLDARNIRDHALDKHRSVDDTPFGGGAGMVMRPDVVDRALADVADRPGPVVNLSPRGRPLDQAVVRDLASEPGITLLCGRYEGIDERVLEARGVQEVSVGDFVLSGGEVAALVVLDAVVRLLPGVMGNVESGGDESFERDLLEYPQYTRPADWNGREVPAVLQSGDHARIARWRREQAEEITRARRPDLWARYQAAQEVPAAPRRQRRSPRRGDETD
ncbi:tRNA (guanosine(37)-N1)-methyltransferase TrmD [Rhodovibrio salinarum]|uniref:tRNA (guanine-N(1)-)-methyltransferase n=1 Tax=Rhodovibrio salinarum TaxID=1087 RepID=A0A934V054_9PROT|nr:tRNA (guanosine(37)-N1)-methyltransferase TrmD [Rhodovibrio salinarum]MBK1697094.1 tRNA (guanosine(37)-N1)-methyltransferase TrmD [Rhodovibrio salinarum]